jgi:hypothetical protein
MEQWTQGPGIKLTMEYPRYIPSTETDEFHCFTDASGHGMGIAIYQRSAISGSTESNLIFAKSLIIPANLKDQEATIP